jgi:hypothetical protein
MNTLTYRVPSAVLAFALLFSSAPGASAAPASASTSHHKASHHSASSLTKKAHKHTHKHKKSTH